MQQRASQEIHHHHCQYKNPFLWQTLKPVYKHGLHVVRLTILPSSFFEMISDSYVLPSRKSLTHTFCPSLKSHNWHADHDQK